MNIYKKVDKIYSALRYFGTNQWTFEDINLQNLFKSLSPTDKQIFEMDIENLDWQEKIHFWAIGIRNYLVKDKLKSCKYALNKQKVLRWLHYIVSALYLYLIWLLVKFCYDLLYVTFF